MRKSAILVFLLLLPVSIRAQNPDLVLNPGSSYVDVGRAIPWSSFNRTYVIVPNSPNASLCVYVVNNNPTSAHTFTTTTFQSADSQVPDYSHNTGRYNSVPLINMPSSVPASSMVSGFTQSTAAAKVAIQFSGTSGAAGNPDTADVFLVQTTSGTCGSASTSNQVQGTTTPGAAVTGNPLLIGGKDGSGNARFASVLDHSALGFAVDGLAIGGTDVGVGATFTTSRVPAGSADGPLDVQVFATNGSAATPVQRTISGSCNSGNGCPGLLVADSGYASTQSATITTNGQSLSLWQSSAQKMGVVETCSLTLTMTNTAGTAPTLDAWLQDSPDGTNWNDRIHFTQATTGTLRVTSGIAGSFANKSVATLTDRTIPAGTIVSGPLDQFGQIVFNIGGSASPSYNVTVVANCK